MSKIGGVSVKYFGTDGFRGEANVKLNVNHAYKVGRFLGNYFADKSDKVRIVIGKDTRCSGFMFESALCAGMTASGADVYLLGVTPTPSVSYIVRKEHFDVAVMISASHNPYKDNGLKVIDGNGHKLSADIEALIEEYIDSENDTLPLATDDNIGRIIHYEQGRDRYAEKLTEYMDINLEGYTVALDCSNGSASPVAKGIFERLGAKVNVINYEPDGVNINTNCGSTHIEGLMQYVKDCGADIGFAFDGDADRCLAVNEKGELIDGDGIMYICACFLSKMGELSNNTVVTTVMSNLGLYKAFDAKGISYEKTSVGDKYVYENMVKNNHSLGGEQSGHIIFSKYATTGDGILTALMVMRVLKDSGKCASGLTDGLVIYPQLLKNVRVADKEAAITDEEVVKAAERINEELGSDGRLLLRKSGTEQLIRVMVEAGNDEICSKYVDMIVELLEKNGHAC